MLGRYVAGTVLVLGVAMLMAPPPPEQDPPAERAAAPEATTAPPAAGDLSASSDAPSPEPAAPAAQAETAEMKSGIEDAVAAAVALDAVENQRAAPAAAESEPTEVQPPAGETAGIATTGAKVVTPPARPDSVPADSAGLSSLADLGGGQSLSLTGQNDVATPPAATSPNAVVLYVTGTTVNVRAGPSTEFRVVGAVTSGEAVELLGSEDGWAQILFGPNRLAGFMSRRYLDYAPADG